MRKTKCPRALPFNLASIGGENDSVRGHHGQWSWLTPKCPNPDEYRPTTIPNCDRGPLSVVHSCRVILPLELLAADNL
jgi:hypothetical protein